MKINKNSWHFKLYKAWHREFLITNEAVSLCSYFWTVVACCFMYFLGVLATLTAGPIMMFFGAKPKKDFFHTWGSYKPWEIKDVGFYPGYFVSPFMVWNFIGYLRTNLSTVHKTWITTVIFLVSFILAMIGIVGSVFLVVQSIKVLIKVLVDHVIMPVVMLFKKGEDALIEEAKPNLLLSYLKARKEKVCPIIEFVDGD